MIFPTVPVPYSTNVYNNKKKVTNFEVTAVTNYSTESENY